MACYVCMHVVHSGLVSMVCMYAMVAGMYGMLCMPWKLACMICYVCMYASSRTCECSAMNHMFRPGSTSRLIRPRPHPPPPTHPLTPLHPTPPTPHLPTCTPSFTPHPLSNLSPPNLAPPPSGPHPSSLLLSSFYNSGGEGARRGEPPFTSTSLLSPLCSLPLHSSLTPPFIPPSPPFTPPSYTTLDTRKFG